MRSEVTEGPIMFAAQQLDEHSRQGSADLVTAKTC